MLQIANALRGREVPRLGWPTTLIPPAGVTVTVTVTASERHFTVDVRAAAPPIHAIARLDLQTREVLVDVAGGQRSERDAMRRLVLAYVDDRNDFDERCGLDAQPAAPTFSESDDSTWSSHQDLAYITNATWYPPTPRGNDPTGWLQYAVDVNRFNRARRQLNAVGSTPQRILPEPATRTADGTTPGPQPTGAAHPTQNQLEAPHPD